MDAPYPSRLTEQKQYTMPRCEVCGDPSYEWTQDWIWHVDREGQIAKGKKRGKRHFRCEKHARRCRHLIRTRDGRLQRYCPSEAEEFHRAMRQHRDPTEVIIARSRWHTQEDEAFDRKWWPEFAYQWEKK